MCGTLVSRSRVPFVLDTMVLADDVVWGVLRGRGTALVAAAEHGAIGLFVSRHVISEVERLLPRRAVDRGVSVSDALDRWCRSYLPVLHVVDVPEDWGSNDPRVRQTTQRDWTDAPTARLTAAVAPALGLGRDKALTEAGLAQPEWLPLVLAAVDRAAHYRGLDGVGGAFVLTAAAARASLAAGGRLPVLAQFAGGVVLAAGFVSWSKSESGKAALRRAGLGLLLTFGTIEELRRSWEALAVIGIVAAPERSSAEVVASELAAGGPMTTDDLATGQGWSNARMRALLTGCPAFIEAKGVWTLGQLGDSVAAPRPEATMVLAHRAMQALERVRNATTEPAGARSACPE